MSVHASYIEEEERLDLSFDGNLDLTVSREVYEICRRMAAGLKSCIVDLSNVERFFHSGAAILQMLYRRMRSLGTTVVFLGDQPDFNDWISLITNKPRTPGHKFVSS
jgi:anti-anti-sigma regulatory factor